MTLNETQSGSGDAVPEQLLELRLLERFGVDGGQDFLPERLDVDSALGELPRSLGPHVARKPRGDPEVVELARADQVQRSAHQRGLINEMRRQRLLQLFALEIPNPRPQADVGRRRVLRLHTRETLDRSHRVDVYALEQHLPRERPAIELPERYRLLNRKT